VNRDYIALHLTSYLSSHTTDIPLLTFRMDSHQDEDETKRDSPIDDPRALVTALTQQLMMDEGNEAQAIPSGTEASASVARTANTGNPLSISHAEQCLPNK
jgi:hypothetical protein